MCWSHAHYAASTPSRSVETADTASTFLPSTDSPTAAQQAKCLHSILDNYPTEVVRPLSPPAAPPPVTTSSPHPKPPPAAPPNQTAAPAKPSRHRVKDHNHEKGRLHHGAVVVPHPGKNHLMKRPTHHPPQLKLSKVTHPLPPAKRMKPSSSSAANNRGMYLSPLPHKMSYTSLVEALHKASRGKTQSCSVIPQEHRLPDPHPTSSPPLPHTHPVFLDHFSSLDRRNVPQEFASPPPLMTSLLVSLPRDVFTASVQLRASAADHNYTPVDSNCMSLKLSVPRSLLPSPCVCSGDPLLFCSICASLYHSSCSHGNLCARCAHRQLPT